MGCCTTTMESCSPRQFLTREEKIEMLAEYKSQLEKETQAVQERITYLKKEN